MNQKQVLAAIDHTILLAVTQWRDIQTLCEQAITHGMASVCIPPSYVKQARDAYADKLVICTVIGFPLGYNTTEVKLAEAEKAIRDGADELDMVVNLGWVKDGKYDLVTQEIAALKEAAGERCLKVIVETCYLTLEEKIALCHAVSEAGADFIKTSTGFGTGGATLEDVRLFAQEIDPRVKIKAAGGIRTKDDLYAFLENGASRIGTSSALKLLFGETADVKQTY